jgi:hypothetical protein
MTVTFTFAFFAEYRSCFLNFDVLSEHCVMFIVVCTGDNFNFGRNASDLYLVLSALGLLQLLSSPV